jgi:soluble lytic murein transglycosylase-like protein
MTPAHSQALGIRTAAVTRSPENIIVNAVQEASRRFHVPASWLRAIIRAESGGDASSVSDKGAIGLMQVMPQTYAELRARHDFGPDPFDPRDNILAGAAYLAQMLARYGASGFLAAYNAGPGRYEDYLTKGRPLPAETTDYVARIAPALDEASGTIAEMHVSLSAFRAPIFVAAPALKTTADGAPKESERIAKATLNELFPVSLDDKLFALETHSNGAPKCSSVVVPTQLRGIFVARISPENTR